MNTAEEAAAAAAQAHQLAASLDALAANLAPAPPPAGALWLGDGSQTLSAQYAEVSDELNPQAAVTTPYNIPDSRISVVTDSRFTHGGAVRFHMNAGDHLCYSGRSELGLGNPTKSPGNFPVFHEGEDLWLAFQVLLPSTYPLNNAKCQSGGIMQFHEQAGPGSPPFGIGAGYEMGGRFGVYRKKVYAPAPSGMSGGVNVMEHVPIGPAPKPETVHNFLVHARFSKSTSGLIEVWLDGILVFHAAGQFGLTQGYEPSHLRVGLYPDTARTESPPMDLLVGGMNISATQAAAETAAWG